jgi:hypothetical protein
MNGLNEVVRRDEQAQRFMGQSTLRAYNVTHYFM